MVHGGSTRNVRQARLGDHLCLPFASDEEQGEVLGAFIADGIDRGERVLYYADHTEPERIGSWLAPRGVDCDRAVADGQLQIRPINENYLFGGRFEPDMLVTTLWVEVRQAREAGYPGLRVTGEMTFGRRPVADTCLLHEFETRLARVFDTRELIAICQYDQRLFDEAAVVGLAARHPHIVQIDPLHDDRRLRITQTYRPRGLRISGIVDVATAGALTATLEHALTWPVRDIHLDLGGLEFIDVAGVRTIVRIAEALAPNRSLVIERLVPGLRRVFAVVGWDRTPGLLIAEEVDPP